MAHRESKQVAGTLQFQVDREVLELLDDYCARTARRRKAAIQIAIVELAQRPVSDPPKLLTELALRKRGGMNTLAKPEQPAKPRNRKEKR